MAEAVVAEIRCEAVDLRVQRDAMRQAAADALLALHKLKAREKRACNPVMAQCNCAT